MGEKSTKIMHGHLTFAFFMGDMLLTLMVAITIHVLRKKVWANVEKRDWRLKGVNVVLIGVQYANALIALILLIMLMSATLQEGLLQYGPKLRSHPREQTPTPHNVAPSFEDATHA